MQLFKWYTIQHHHAYKREIQTLVLGHAHNDSMSAVLMGAVLMVFPFREAAWEWVLGLIAIKASPIPHSPAISLIFLLRTPQQR